MDDPQLLCFQHPVRKSRIQKEAFRRAVVQYTKNLGYTVTIEHGSMGAKNIVIGDPEKALYLVTAHYDTCARLPFPNLLTPCSLLLFVGWQLLLVVILCVPAGILGSLIASLLKIPSFSAFFAYVLLWAELLLMLVGPANRHNVNDNSSGVITALKTAQMLPAELRDRVCFVLFDLEEAGLLGSASYRKTHRRATEQQLVFNLDCVGEGDDILLFPTKKMKKEKSRLACVDSCCQQRNGKKIELRSQGFSVYPSDQSNFPYGIGIAVFCRSKRGVLYLAKIHTPKDTTLDENNVLLICEFLSELISKQP